MINCGKKDPGYARVEGLPERANADVVINNFIAIGKEGNRVSWIMESKRAYVNNRTGMVDIENIDLQYFDEDGKKTIITGEKGELNQNTKIMILDNKIKVLSNNGRRLFTEHLIWDAEKRQLHTNTPVRIIFPGGDQLNGGNLSADMNLNKIVVEKASGQLYQKK